MDIDDCALMIILEQKKGSLDLFQYFGIFDCVNIVAWKLSFITINEYNNKSTFYDVFWSNEKNIIVINGMNYLEIKQTEDVFLEMKRYITVYKKYSWNIIVFQCYFM